MARRDPFPVVPRGAVLAGALGIGVAGDVLLHSSSGPGLNLLLLFVGLAGAVALVCHRAGLKPSREALAWFAAGLLFATAFVLRAAPALQLLAFLAASAAFALPALRAGRAWLRGSGVSDHLEAVVAAALHSALAFPLRFISGWFSSNRTSSRSGRAWAVTRGLLLAVPLLIVFGALFMSADRVFEALVTDLFRAVDPEEVVSHIALVGLLTWLASGYLSGFVTGTRLRGWIEPVLSRPSVGILEAGTVLGLVALLFAAFVLVQLRYLFGGGALVEVTPGLTYAEYAREGFLQIVVAAALVLPMLLACDWLLRRERKADEWTFRLLGGVQLLLLAIVIASAFQRLHAYLEAYGLTESRFYGAVLLVWLALLGVWFAATILLGRRDRFAAPALVSGFTFVAVLLVANPDEQIARTNLTRGGDLDAAYLGSLSADAVPTLIDALPGFSSEARCAVAWELQRRWGPDTNRDWRSWNRSEARARRLVRDAPADALSTIGCPEPVTESLAAT